MVITIIVTGTMRLFTVMTTDEVVLSESWWWLQQCAGRSSGLLGPPTPVGDERGCATDVSSPPIWPHHQHVSLSSLAARAGASSVQACHPDVKSFARTHAGPLDRVADLTGHWIELFVLLPLAIWSCRVSRCQLSPTALSRLSVHGSGTIYRLMWRLLSHCLHSASGWKFVSFAGYFLSVK